MNFFCKYCQQKLDAPRELYGCKVDCPSCGKLISIAVSNDCCELTELENSDEPSAGASVEKFPDKKINAQPKSSPRKRTKKFTAVNRKKSCAPPKSANNKKKSSSTYAVFSTFIFAGLAIAAYFLIVSGPQDIEIQQASIEKNFHADQEIQTSLKSLTEIEPFLNKYCISCHSEKKQKGNQRLDNLDYDLKEHSSLENWQNILDALNLSEMPPRKADQPQDKELMMAIATITEKLSQAYKKDTQTGGVIKMRHLNKREYRNNIKDLFGFYLADNFMPDDIAEGFDTNGSNQELSFKDIENYLELGKWIVRTNIDTFHRDWRATRPKHKKWDWSPHVEASNHLFKDVRGGHRYKFTIQAYSEEDVKAKITMSDPNVPGTSEIIGWLDLKAKKGEKQKFEIFHQTKQSHNGHRINIEVGRAKGAYIAEILQEGPIREDSLFHDLIKSLPKKNPSEQNIARILSTFAERAFRYQGFDPSYLNGLMSIYKTNKESGKDVLAALVEPFSIIISSPSFLYIKEKSIEKSALLNQHEYAIRLANFLWSSPPDEELYKLAKEGKLNDPAIRKKQMYRMLQSSKADSSLESFINQWLGMIRYDETDIPDELEQSGFRTSARQEPAEYFKYLVRHNKPVDELIDADFVVVDHVLAKHYGIQADINEFQKVELPQDHPRGGLLTQAAFLVMGSTNGRTSPTIRGTMLRETFLHNPPPLPPPNVPMISSELNNSATVRELVELHQNTPQCASCHDRIDPIGLGLENFDYLGQFRTTEWVNEKDRVMLGDFEGDDYTKWHAKGDAFLPKREVGHNSSPIKYWVNKGLAITTGRSVGTLTSPEFIIDHKYCNFLIAGCKDNKVRFELMVENEVVDVALGNSTHLKSNYFDLSEYKGKKAQLRIVDENSGGSGDGLRILNGNIALDEVFLANYKVKEDVIIGNFEGKDFEDWKVTGTAFGDKPANVHWRDFTGTVASSHSGTKNAIGTLTSPEFRITHKYINLRVSGKKSKYLSVQLIQNHKVIDTIYGSEGWVPRTFDVRKLLAQKVQIKIIDDDKRTRGSGNRLQGMHILVDDIRQSDSPFMPEGNEGLEEVPVDASGYLPSGEKYTDFRGLKKSLIKNKHRLAESIYSSLLSYGIGREIEFIDQDEIHQSLNDLQVGNFLLQELLYEVINSPIFSKK
jgi:hypothetical protein